MKIRKMVLILLAAFFYGSAVFFCRSAEEDAGRTYLLLPDPIDASRAQEIFDREAALAEPTGFCFWGEREDQWVSCGETGGIAEVTQVLLSGNPGLLDAQVLTWQKGCFLDETTARALFGTVDCSEQVVWHQERPYRVLGTISVQSPTMLALVEGTDGSVLDRCVLQVAAEKGQQVARQFLLRWGLAGERMDYYPLWVVIYDFLLLLPGILVFQLYFRGSAHIQSRGGRWILQLIAGMLLGILISRIRFPPDMFPDRWSDFSFWGNWWAGQRQNFQLLLRTPMGEHHLQMRMNMVKSIGSSTAAVLLSLWILRRRKHADTAD